MTAFLLDHLWQSTAMLAVAGALTQLFRNNGAHVRHALWTAASVKFLIPFAALASLGEIVSGLLASSLRAPPMIESLEVVAQPFSGSDAILVAVAGQGVDWLPLVLIAWAIGVLVLGVFWFRRWLTLRAALHAAHDAAIDAPMSVKLSPALLEPGLVGILRPTLLLPQGIADRLTPAELRSILAHEACHLRRRDNLTAALHMLVEAIFWFWPPVWWLGTRLIDERERACDEAVLASGNEPQVYAEGILKVCKFYVQSPLACAAGVSGADLKKRMEDIMRNNVIARLSLSKKMLLLASGTAVLALPLLLGLPNVPVALAQSGLSASPQRHMAVDAAPTKPAVTPLPRSASDSAPVRARKAVRQLALPAAAPMAPEPVAAPQPPLQVAQLPAPPAQGAGCRLSSVGLEQTHTLTPYPVEAQRAGETGTVEMIVTIAADGHVSDTTLGHGSGFARLDEAAMNHVRQNWLWQPPSCVPTRTAVRVVFGMAPPSALQTGDASCVLSPVNETHTQPPYPPVSRRLGEIGIVEMRVTIAPNGTVNDIAVTNSSGEARLDDAAMAHVRGTWLWQPKNCGAAQTMVRVAFSLMDAH